MKILNVVGKDVVGRNSRKHHMFKMNRVGQFEENMKTRDGDGDLDNTDAFQSHFYYLGIPKILTW